MRLFIIIFFYISLTSEVSAQLVPRKTIVEHFTNTVCSVCANRNPGFYNGLRQADGVLHIAYHPSSPYSSCKINQMNKTENDARTRYYNIYGSTPKFIVNGKERFVNDLSDSKVYDTYKSETTNIEMNSKLVLLGKDSIALEVTLIAAEANDVAEATLYMALVQDTLNYIAPNGERMHFDVFRKSFSGDNAMMVSLPRLKGEVVKIRRVIALSSDWEISRLYSINVLNRIDKSLIQAVASPLLDTNVTTATKDADLGLTEEVLLFPNPANDELNIKVDNQRAIVAWKIYDVNGKSINLDGAIEANAIKVLVGSLNPSIYYLKLSLNNGATYSTRFIKK